jgi:hypothetical protein
MTAPVSQAPLLPDGGASVSVLQIKRAGRREFPFVRPYCLLHPIAYFFRALGEEVAFAAAKITSFAPSM